MQSTFKLISALDDFVKKYCARHGRDSTHGYEHAKDVSETVVQLFPQTNQLHLHYIIALAWLHDIGDYKYENGDGENEVIQFVTNAKCFSNWCMDVKNQFLTDLWSISFSKERKFRKIYGCVPKYNNLRNAVSDIDKIKSLGKEGFDRLIIYLISIGCVDIQETIVQYTREKFGIMVSYGYIRTEIGRELAKVKFLEFKQAFEDYFGVPLNY
jgi:hypothetical protein